MLLGLAIYALPGEFAASIYDPVRPFFPYLSAGLVAGGVTLLVLHRYSLPGWARRLLFLLPAAPLAVLTWNFGLTRAWTGLILYGTFAILLLPVPWLSAAQPEAGEPGGVDLFGFGLALIEASVGALMLLAPEGFATPSYAPIRSLLPLAGVAGLAGAAALLLRAAGTWTGHPGRALLHLPPSALPLLLCYSFLRTSTWTGVMAWGVVAVATLIGSRAGGRWRRARPEEDPDEEFQSVERMLETWNWSVALAEVALTAIAGAHPTLASHLFVLGAAAHNTLMYWALPGLGTPKQRIFWHLVFLAGATGLLLGDTGPTHQVALIFLVLPAPLAAHALGLGASRWILAVSLTALAASSVISGMLEGAPPRATLADTALSIFAVGVAAWMGARSAVAQRQLRQVALERHGALVLSHGELQAANEELQAQHEEIQAQAEELLNQNQVIQGQHDRLRETLESTRALAEERARLVGILEATPDFVGMSTVDGQGVYLNGAALRLLGVGPEEVRQRTIGHAHPEQVLARLREEAIPTAMRDGIWRGETVWLGSDGREVPVSQVIIAHKGRDGQPELISTIARDISDRKRLEDRLATALSDRENIMNTVFDIIYVIDLKGNLVEWNRRAEVLTGMSAAELKGKPVLQFFPEREHAAIIEAIRKAFETGYTEVEGSLLTRDGTAIPHMLTGIPLKDRNGNVIGLTGTGRDITDLKLAEEVRRESEERFRSAFESASVGMALVGTDGRLLKVNAALCEMLGYAEPELLAMTVADFTHPDDLGQDSAQMARMRAGEIPVYQKEKRYIHKAGHLVWALLNLSMVRDLHGKPPYFVGQVQDITERKLAEAELYRLATDDPLTGLFNRRRFQDELENQLEYADRYGSHGAVLFVDLDGFKYVNDTLGHQAGDELLVSVAALLRRRMRKTDFVARLGGDEFAILLLQVDQEEAQQIAGELLKAVQGQAFPVVGRTVNLAASTGIALFPQHGLSATELLAKADIAMYEAKESGRGRVSVYSDEGQWSAAAASKLHGERLIRAALEGDGFILQCQPIMDLRTGEIAIHELLLRMRGEDGALVPPEEFLPVAERFGLIHAIDRWVLQKAIALLAERRQAGQEMRLAVNLSGRAFSDTDLLDLLRREISSSDIDPGQLVLEITETAAIGDIDQAGAFMAALKDAGCGFALDDFGSGFSSFASLRHLPVDYMKIAGQFICNLQNSPADLHLVRAMVEMARGLGKEVVAEWVEDEETLALLRALGVEYAQGFHIGRPGPVEQAWPPTIP